MAHADKSGRRVVAIAMSAPLLRATWSRLGQRM